VVADKVRSFHRHQLRFVSDPLCVLIHSSVINQFITKVNTTMAAIRTFMLAVILVLTAGVVNAHEGGGITGGFISGFTHPVNGWDHVIAMVAVGLWGAFLGAPAIWLLPVVFPLVMAFGGVLGVMGVPIPAVETGIAVSAIVLGGVVALAMRPPLWITVILVGLFAVFHGHAHGTELPNAAGPLAYSVGFVVATGLLHLSGIVFGLVVRWPLGKIAVQAGGGVIAMVGLGFLTGVV
jgi:urease accessory protein